MTSLTQHFGELRAIIQSPPSVIAWHRLCDMVDAWPDPQHLQHVALPYAQDILDRTWPDVMRQAPASWLMRMMRGEEYVRGFELIRRVGHTQEFIGREPCLEIFATAPSEEVCRVIAHPQMRHITQLNLRNLRKQPDAIVDALAQTRTFERLVFLNLGRILPDRERFATLWDNSALATLQKLELWDTAIGDEELRAMAQSPHLRNLTYLELSDTYITARGLEELYRSPYIQELQQLFLADNDIGDAGVEAIVCAQRCRHLRHLEIPGCSISPQGAKLLASCEALSGLEQLLLWDNPILDEGASALVQSTHLSKLEVLAIDDIRTTPNFWREHANAIALPSLKDLRLGTHDEISSQSLIALATTDKLGSLQKLEFNHVAYDAPALKALTQATWMPQIKHLNLFRLTNTSDEGIGDFLLNARFERLESLLLGELDLDSEALQKLANNPSLGRLTSVEIMRETALKGGVAHLLESRVFDLEHLDVWSCVLSEEDILAMIPTQNMQRMHTLKLCRCEFPKQAFDRMIQNPGVANIRELRVLHDGLDTASIQAIASSPYLGKLRVLDLGSLDDPEDANLLAKSPHLHADVRVTFEQKMA